MSTVRCEVFGCNRVEKPSTTVDLVIGEDTHTIRVCDFHQSFFEDTSPDTYSIGLTFTQEIEIRTHPIQPAPSEEPA